MNTCPADPFVEIDGASFGWRPTEPDEQARLRTIIDSLAGTEPGDERRSDRRYPYAHLITLFPVETHDHSLIGPPIVVVGKDVSDRGLSFYHTLPLPYRRVVADLESHRGERMAVLIDLTWCRFTMHGWYENGGRFLQLVDLEEFQ